ncbi:hypothetical protein SCLCIDRAFT_298909 [Scleroderma citrinum Foug A]|uniref:Uncharacterized protein n=1 Tax=Scleroderma citrinum Foug A TaxID=1036808 RepID=A0A0C3DGD4_9AGAM|nr:hypothetical protein SCLCIDRAFT_298909 [Scleroderma citrinum Foug A]
MYYMFTCMEGKTAHIVIIAGNLRGWSRFMYKMAYIKVTFWSEIAQYPIFHQLHTTPLTQTGVLMLVKSICAQRKSYNTPHGHN